MNFLIAGLILALFYDAICLVTHGISKDIERHAAMQFLVLAYALTEIGLILWGPTLCVIIGAVLIGMSILKAVIRERLPEYWRRIYLILDHSISLVLLGGCLYVLLSGNKIL